MIWRRLLKDSWNVISRLTAQKTKSNCSHNEQKKKLKPFKFNAHKFEHNLENLRTAEKNRSANASVIKSLLNQLQSIMRRFTNKTSTTITIIISLSRSRFPRNFFSHSFHLKYNINYSLRYWKRARERNEIVSKVN
jgi:hypothetical protein